MDSKKLNQLTTNDRREVLKMQKYLKLRKTKRGRWYLANQKYWKDYQGL